MANFLGDYAEDYPTLNFKFTTRTLAGAPATLTGGVVKVYKASATDSETATGVTLAADFDGVTGLNNVLIDLSADAFYAVANDYSVVITTGTVDSVSVVGEVLATFSIENRSDSAGVTEILTRVPDATAGAAGGLLIAGNNAGTTTFGALTVTGAATITGGLISDITGDITGNLSGSVGTLTTLPAITMDWLTAAGIKADAVTKIQSGIITPANITFSDTEVTIT